MLCCHRTVSSAVEQDNAFCSSSEGGLKFIMDKKGKNPEDYLQLRRNIADGASWKQMQKTTFTRWANEHLKHAGEQIVNLERDLADGLLLTTLLEVLSKKELGTKQMLRHKKLDIVTKALKFLEQHEKISLVSIGKYNT